MDDDKEVLCCRGALTVSTQQPGHAHPRSTPHASLHGPPRRFLIVCYATEWDRVHFAVNAVIVAVLFVAKLPELDGVRVFNINGAPSSASKDS